MATMPTMPTVQTTRTTQPPSVPIIEVRGLIKTFGVMPVLRRLDLCVTHGEFLAVLGPNGSGKSTLLRLLAGLSKPNGGTIRIGGWELPHEAAAVRAQIGLVSHEPLLYEALTARENLQFFACLYGLPTNTPRLMQLLEQVGLARRANDKVRTFSRGMQQRLSIARALIHNPDILLMDEPYTGLDQDASLMLDDILKTAHQAGHTIFMITHQFDRAASLAGRIVILSRGQIVYDSTNDGKLDQAALVAQYAHVTNRVSGR